MKEDGKHSVPLGDYEDGLFSLTTFNEGQLNLAVSGGADSTAMLILAAHLPYPTTVWHVHHGLRAEADRDAEFVNGLASSFGAEFKLRKVKLTPGPNLEARARQARFSVLPPDIALAHTADDQFETFLINIMRGSGLDGMVSMSSGPRHPILGLRRSETEQLCASHGIVPVHDEMNDDEKYVRVRVRNHLIPLMNDIAKRDVTALFARQAELIRSDVDYLEFLSSDLDPTSAKKLRDQPEPLSRRALRRWLRTEEGQVPDAEAIRRVLKVVKGEVKAAEVAGVGRVSRSLGKLHQRKSKVK